MAKNNFVLSCFFKLVILAILLSALCYNWFLALHSLLFDGESVLAKRLLAGFLISVILILTLLGLGFGLAGSSFSSIAFNLSFAFLDDTYALSRRGTFLISAYSTVAVTLYAFCLFLLLVLGTSTLFGFVLAKKKGLSKENLDGILRLFVIAILLFVGTAFKSALACLDLAQYYVPTWFRLGLIYIGSSSVIAITFLVFIGLVFYGMHRKTTVAPSGMSSKLLSDESDDSSQEMRRIPKAYEI